MTAINAATAAAASANSSTAFAASKSVLDKDDFLQLLIAQLQHQDPLNPSDPTEFTAQLSQFSSLEQLFTVNENLAKMADSSNGMERLSALSLIGNEVVVNDGAFRFDGTPVTLGYRLGGQADTVSLAVVDRLGRTVAAINSTETGSGDHFLSWDGTDQYGQKVGPGDYTLIASGKLGRDQLVQASTMVRGRVTGVDLDPTGPIIVTSTGEYRFDDVGSIRGAL